MAKYGTTVIYDGEKWVPYMAFFNPNVISDVIFQYPKVIVVWHNKMTTEVTLREKYDPELGLALCIVKGMCGNLQEYKDIFKKWLPKAPY